MDKTRFLDDVVFGWIKKDFERMIKEMPVRPRQAGNINFFLALCVLVSMEHLGGYLLGKDKGFEGNVKEYINRCFPNPREYPIEILKDIYRNGLAHEYFPRGAVSRSNERPPIFVDDRIGIVLDAETLANDFLNSLEKFKDELDEVKYKKRMQEIKQKIKDRQDKNKQIINNLPKKPTSTNSITASITIVTGERIPFKPISTTPPHEEDED